MALLTAPTLQRLTLEVRIFLNQQSSSNSFWSDAELGNYINDGIRQYFTVLCAQGEGQFDKAQGLDVTANVETVALPSDCYEVRALYSHQTDRMAMLKYQNNVDDSYYTDVTTSSSIYEPYYYFRGENIVLRPIPGFTSTGATGGTYALQLEYTAFPDTLITGLDTLTSHISPIFKELVIAYAVYKAKLKESSVQGGNTYAPIQAHLADLFQSFKQSVASRSKYPQYVKAFDP